MSQTGSPPRRKPKFRERNATKQTPAARPARQSVQPPAPPPPTRTPAPAPTLRQRLVPRLTVESALYLAILAFAFAIRIWDVGSRAMHGDESIHAWMAWRLFTGQGYQYDPVYHGPLQFPITAVYFFLFGVSEVTGRLMSVLFGTALVGLPFFLRREMGRSAALIAAALIAISPEFIYDARLERDDSFTVLFAMTLAIALFSYVRTHRIRYVYMGAASAALSLAAMENSYITYFVFVSFVVLVLLGEWLATRTSTQLPAWAGTTSGVPWSALGAAGVVLLLAFAVTVKAGLYAPVPVLAALILIGTAMRQAFVETRADGGRRRFWQDLQSIPRGAWLNAATMIIAILFAFFSTFGTNLHGIWDSTQPFFNSNGVCSGNSFPLNPCRKDIVGGLFYWLSQHKVARGGQPWFYYSLLFGLYEQLAFIFGAAGIIYFLRRPTRFTTFVTYWAVLMFGIYSWAGEKFPWLLVHPLLPFTLLAAMFISRIPTFSRPVIYALAAVIGILALLELHNTYEVNFVNGADPVEMMVYVQSAPDTPKLAADITRLSHQVTGGNTLGVTVDSEETWPFAWYLRDMPDVAYPSSSQVTQKPFSTNPVILVDMANGDQARLAPKLGDYTGRQYVLRWWFPEDYKLLTWGSFFHDAVNPGYWSVIWDWLTVRRPFGPKGTVNFYYYVKKGLASPF